MFPVENFKQINKETFFAAINFLYIRQNLFHSRVSELETAVHRQQNFNKIAILGKRFLLSSFSVVLAVAVAWIIGIVYVVDILCQRVRKFGNEWLLKCVAKVKFYHLNFNLLDETYTKALSEAQH